MAKGKIATIAGTTGHVATHQRRKARQERAQARQEERNKRSDKEQLKVLKERGFTEGREVERLKARIAEAKSSK